MPSPADCWFLTGPTASGKTALGLELAERLNAEIVSMDSMAVYRGLDIGTAKPNPAEQAAARHHLLDCREPREDFSLAEYLAAVGELLPQIQSRGKQALFVGGTPLYLKGLLRGIFQGPPADWDFRRQLLADAEGQSPNYLQARLRAVDSVAATRLHANDQRRIVRALEVFAKTGTPISQWQQQFEIGRPAEACRVFVLDWPKVELQRRCDLRVDAMFAAGLVGEVQDLLERGIALGRTAGQAVGYREVLEHLQGERNLADTIELVKLRTRQFAKRQGTWFRSLSECRFIPAAGQVDLLADRIIALAPR